MIVLDKDNTERTTHDPDGRFRSCDANWIQYDIDPFIRDCECGGLECDPDTCPRFTDECCECDREFRGSGWLCLDGGDIACEDCVSFRTDSDGNHF